MGCAFTLDKLVYTGVDSPFTFIPLYPVLESELILVWKKKSYPVKSSRYVFR